MASSPLEDFVQSVSEYCGWMEDSDCSDLRGLYLILARLQRGVLLLPRVEPDSDGRDDIEVSTGDYDEIVRRLANLPINTYWEVLEPFGPEVQAPACGSLRDDLADIWRDLKNGLLNYHAGRVNDGTFDWVTSYETHWGGHLTSALYVLYRHLFQ